MATELQREATKILVETGRNASAAMVRAGYSKNTAKAPSKLTRSKGFKEEIIKYRPEDLTPELIKTCLVEDIKLKPRNRVKELSLGAEILQMKKNPDPIDIKLSFSNAIKQGKFNE